MTGPDVFALAKKKARYGHKSWIVWRDRDGIWNAAVESVETIKAAMLAVGTQGRWTAVSRIDHVQRWRDGVRILGNARVGAHPNGRV